jgi:hypothetical protein
LLEVGVIAAECQNASSGQAVLTDMIIDLVVGKENSHVWVDFLGLVKYLVQVLLHKLVVALALG